LEIDKNGAKYKGVVKAGTIDKAGWIAHGLAKGIAQDKNLGNLMNT